MALFEKYGVQSQRETRARSNIMFLKYAHRLNVEALSTLELSTTRILPAAITYQERLARSIGSVLSVNASVDLEPQKELLALVAETIGELKRCADRLRVAQSELESDKPPEGQLAVRMRDEVLPAMNAVREQADRLEGLVDDDLWPLPKYGELLSLD